jgi:hypothetical protein
MIEISLARSARRYRFEAGGCCCGNGEERREGKKKKKSPRMLPVEERYLLLQYGEQTIGTNGMVSRDEGKSPGEGPRGGAQQDAVFVLMAVLDGS